MDSGSGFGNSDVDGPPQPSEDGTYNVGGEVFCSCSDGSYRTYCCSNDAAGGVNWNGVVNIKECTAGSASTCFMFAIYKYDPADEDDDSLFAQMYGADANSLTTYTNYCQITNGKLSIACEGAIRAIGGNNWRKGIQLVPDGATYGVDTVLTLNPKEWHVVIVGDLPNFSITSVSKPTAAGFCNDVTYNGKEQTLTKAASGGYTFSGNKGTNVGEYTVTATLQNGYVWADGSYDPITFKCSIKEQNKTVGKPTTASACNDLTYNGQEQTLTKGVPEGYTYSNIKGKNAGSYTVTATLASGYSWSDNSTGKATVSCEIKKATPTITLSATSGTTTVGGTVKFNEKANVAGKFTNTSSDTGKATVSPSVSANEIAVNTDTPVTVSGVANGNATITVLFTPTDTTNYNSITSISNGGRTYAVTVGNSSSDSKTVDLPTPGKYCKTGLIYNEHEQIITKDAATGYTFSNNKQTNAGKYSVVATLQSGYKWSNGKTGDVTFECEISKVKPVIKVDPDNITLVVGENVVIGVTSNINGKFEPASDNNKIATSSSSGDSKIRINGVSNGTTVVRVKFIPSDSTNYESVIIPITVKVVGGVDNTPTNTNVTENPQTGTIAIVLAWIIGISAIGYAFWYYKQLNYNNN